MRNTIHKKEIINKGALPLYRNYQERVAALKRARGALVRHGNNLKKELLKLRGERGRKLS